MSEEHIQSVRIYVTTNEGGAYEVDDIVETRAELRLAIARLGALIEDELDDVLDGDPVHVEHDSPDRITITTTTPDDEFNATILQSPGDQPALWLPNEDGYDGSRIYADQLADTIALINRAAAIIDERNKTT